MGYHPAKRAIGLQQVILTNDLVKLARTQPLSQRLGRASVEAGGGEEIGHWEELAAFEDVREPNHRRYIPNRTSVR